MLRSTHNGHTVWYIVSDGGGPANDSLHGRRAAGIVSNCPIVALS